MRYPSTESGAKGYWLTVFKGITLGMADSDSESVPLLLEATQVSRQLFHHGCDKHSCTHFSII